MGASFDIDIDHGSRLAKSLGFVDELSWGEKSAENSTEEWDLDGEKKAQGDGSEMIITTEGVEIKLTELAISDEP